MFKTVVIDYNPKAEAMAQAVEEEANRLYQKGYEVISFAVTPSAKGIILAKEKVNNGEETS